MHNIEKNPVFIFIFSKRNLIPNNNHGTWYTILTWHTCSITISQWSFLSAQILFLIRIYFHDYERFIQHGIRLSNNNFSFLPSQFHVVLFIDYKDLCVYTYICLSISSKNIFPVYSILIAALL